MNADQRNMLFGIFAKLAHAMARKTAETKLALRNEITTELFGELLSWGALDEDQIDDLKARMEAMLHPGDYTKQLADSPEAGLARRRARLVRGIESDMARNGFSEGYVLAILADTDDVAHWRETLPPDRLKSLRQTLWNRARAKSRTPEQQAKHQAFIAAKRAKSRGGNTTHGVDRATPETAAPPPHLYRRPRKVHVTPNPKPLL